MPNQNTNKYSEQDYINKCHELGLNYKGYYKSENKKKGTMVQFICDKHNNIGIQETDWSHFKNSKKGCPYCTGRYRTTEDFKSLISKDIEVLGEYTRAEKPIKCRCKICNYEWDPLPRDLMNKRLQKTNSSGCPQCAENNRHIHRRKSQKDFESELKHINPLISIIGNYAGAHSKIHCKCNKCGCEWEGYPANLLNKSAGCPRCHLSDGERRLVCALESLNVNYKTQYTFEDLKNVFNLRFDAYDIDNNIAYEYNGEQHYFPIDFGSRGDEYAQKEFELNKKRDEIKIEYCKNHNIELVIIPYWELDNIETIIQNKYKKIA